MTRVICEILISKKICLDHTVVVDGVCFDLYLQAEGSQARRQWKSSSMAVPNRFRCCVMVVHAVDIRVSATMRYLPKMKRWIQPAVSSSSRDAWTTGAAIRNTQYSNAKPFCHASTISWIEYTNIQRSLQPASLELSSFNYEIFLSYKSNRWADLSHY